MENNLCCPCIHLHGRHFCIRPGRAGVEPPAEVTADFLVGERARELMWEAHRRTDLIRFGLYNTDSYLWPYKGGDSFAGQAFPEYKCLFPIPPTELAANDKLVQNPGY